LRDCVGSGLRTAASSTSRGIEIDTGSVTTKLKSTKEYADRLLVDRVLDPPPWARLPEAVAAD
jgi:hypothetical protein